MSLLPVAVKESDKQALSNVPAISDDSPNSSLVARFELPSQNDMMAQVVNASRDLALKSAQQSDPEELEKMMNSMDITDNSGPITKTEMHSDTEEAEEFFEKDGKLYKRKIKRRIVREKQIYRQIMHSPAMLDHPAGLLTQSSCPSNTDRTMASLSPNCGRVHDRFSPPDVAQPPPSATWNSPKRTLSYQDQSPALQYVPESSNKTAVCLQPLNNQEGCGDLNPMNNYLFQFGQYDNSEAIVSADFFQQIFQDYQSILMTFEDLESPNFKTRSVSMAQRFSHTTASGAIVNTGTLVTHSRTVRMLSRGSDNLKAIEDLPSQHGGVTFEELPPSPTALLEESTPEWDCSSHIAEKKYEGPWWSPMLEKVNATQFLVLNDSPQINEVSVKGGFRDALIVYATTAGKPPKDYYLFYQSFLVTYRTFISPKDLIQKLVARYAYFRDEPNNEISDNDRAKTCTSILSFLIAVVSQLKSDLSPDIEVLLKKFAEELKNDANEKLAEKLIETTNAQKLTELGFSLSDKIGSSPETKPKSLNILEINAKVLAEQMTLIEADIFNEIELKDLLDIDAIEKYRVNSLNRCATHSNNVTLWTRTLIYSAEVKKGTGYRDKIMLKLFEVMEHLRTLKNFSSYLAMLVAFVNTPDCLISKKLKAKLDPIRPYMTPPSFTEYRQELERSDFPCLPYMGLILQHLILLAMGNQLIDPPNILPSSHLDDTKEFGGPIVNFWRCWKHFLIISMFFRREKIGMSKCSYDLKRNPAVIKFINNFEDHIPKQELDSLYDKLSKDMRRSSKKC